jgi:hypothetical protein
MPYNAFMPQVGETYIEVRADTSQFGKDLQKGVTSELDKATDAARKFADDSGKSVKSFGDQLKGGIQKAAIPAGIALAGLGAIAKGAVGAASDLGESINAVNVTFGKASAGILQLSKDSATAVGLSSAEFNSLAVQFSSFATRIAGPGGDVVKTIQDISTRAADFASVMNLDVDEAARIFQSGLAGETEPLKRFGIDLSETAVKAYAMANGIGDGSGKLTEQEKVLARHGALMEQTNKTQGDFANTSDGLANRQRILSAEMENMKAKVGDLLVPAFESLQSILRVVIDFFAEHQTIALTLGGVLAGVAVSILAINAALKVQAAYTALSAGVSAAYALVTGTATTALVAETAATTAATAAQTGLNTAMALNPIGLIVVAILALVAAFVIAYKKIDWFRAGVNKIINIIIGYFEFMVNAWIKVINGLTSGINKLSGLFGKIGIDIPKIGQIAEVTFGRVGEAAQKAASAADFRKFEESTKDAGAAAEEVTPTITNLGGAADKAGEAASKAAAKVKTLRDGLGKGFEDNLTKAKDVLEKAQKAFSDFAVDVSKAVTAAFSFGNAFKSAQDNTANLTDAISDQTKAEKALADARAENDPVKIAKATADLAIAVKAVTEAQKQPMTFFDNLDQQAAKAKDFGVLVNRLIAGGLSDAALQQVLSAGVDAGSGIATEILASADGILKANTLTAQVQAVGDQVGLNAAANFKQAGVTAGEALVAGVTEVISKYKVNLKSKKLTAKQLTKLQKDFNLDVEFQFSSGVPELANGGIFAGRQNAIIGEAGAEAVIPLTRPQRALDLLEQSGLASLARGRQGAAVNIENATFVEPIDAQLLAAKVMVAERTRSFAQ